MSVYNPSNMVTAEYSKGSQTFDPSGNTAIALQETPVRDKIRQAILAARYGAITGPDSGINILRDSYLLAPPTFSPGNVFPYLYAPVTTAANRVYVLAETGYYSPSTTWPVTGTTEPTHTETTLGVYDIANPLMWAYIGNLNVLPANSDTPTAFTPTVSGASVTQQITYTGLISSINWVFVNDPAQIVQRYSRQIIFAGGRVSDSAAGSVSSAPAIGGMESRGLFRCNTRYIRFVFDGLQNGLILKINGKLVTPGVTYPTTLGAAGFQAYEAVIELQMPDNTERVYEVMFKGSSGGSAQLNRIFIDAGATITPWYPERTNEVSTSNGISIVSYGTSLQGSAPPMLFAWTFPRWFAEFIGSKKHANFAVGGQGFFNGTAGYYRVWEQVNKNPDRTDKNAQLVLVDGLTNDSGSSDANIMAGVRKAYAELRTLYDINKTLITFIGHLTAPDSTPNAVNMTRQENLLRYLIETEFKPKDPNVEFVPGYTGTPSVFTGRPGYQMPAGLRYPEGNSTMYHDGWADSTHYGLRGAEYLGTKWLPAALMNVL
jgi:hypothetical protein